MQNLRGVWIPNVPYSQVLDSRKNTAEAMDFLKKIGCNVVFPVVWNQGYTLFPSKVMQKYGFNAISPYFAVQKRDPLADVISQARRVGLAVIPWFEYGFIGSLLADGSPILNKKPQWAARDHQGKMLTTPPHIWMNALDPEVQQFFLSLILEVAQNYNVDGIQLDDHFGLPVNGGYDDKTTSLYRQQFSQEPPTNVKDEKWIQWRADVLTKFLRQLYLSVKKIGVQKKKPLLVSVAPSVQPFGLNSFLQDSDTWVKEGLVDIVNPQIYRPQLEDYKFELEKIQVTFTATQLEKFAPGIALIGSSQDLTYSDVMMRLECNRENGLDGYVFFEYERLQQLYSNFLITRSSNVETFLTSVV